MTKKEAQEAYRNAWNGFVLAKTTEDKDFFEDLMDSLHSHCTDPGEYCGDEFRAFIKTLPGYENYYLGIIADLELLIAKMDKKE